jgi:HEAT repeat protein
VGQLGHKDKAVEILLGLAEDQTQDGYLRRSCASALGQLGHKDKAVDILVDLYLAQPNKTEIEARFIYDSLWELTVV